MFLQLCGLAIYSRVLQTLVRIGCWCQGEQDRVENPASTLLAKLSSVAWGSVYLEIGHLAPILTKAP